MSSLWSHFGFGSVQRSSLDKLLTRHDDFLSAQARHQQQQQQSQSSASMTREGANIQSPSIGQLSNRSSPTLPGGGAFDHHGPSATSSSSSSGSSSSSSRSSGEYYEQAPSFATKSVSAFEPFPAITQRISSVARVQLEEILDEDDVIREATKEGDPRLIRFLSDAVNLSKMMGYVIGRPRGLFKPIEVNKEFMEPEDEDFRFSYICTQILSEGTDELLGNLVASSNHETILSPFWHAILDADPALIKDGVAGSDATLTGKNTSDNADLENEPDSDDEENEEAGEARGRAVDSPSMSATSRPSKSIPRTLRKRLKTNPAVARYVPAWAKVNSALFAKRPLEMLTFLKMRPEILDSLLRHAENSTIAEFILKIIHCEGPRGSPPVTAWLSQQKMMHKLSAFLSPQHSISMHQVIGDLLKSIIMMCASNPDQGHLGPTHLIDDLVHPDFVERLCSYALDGSPSSSLYPQHELRRWEGRDSSKEWKAENAASSLVNILVLFTELIRKNNADFAEQAQVEAVPLSSDEEDQESSEVGFTAPDLTPFKRIRMTSRGMRQARRGVVDLRDLLKVLTGRLPDFQRILRRPRMGSALLKTTFGEVLPLTFERFRVCELYAEMLHCSNMALSNRFPGEEPPPIESSSWGKQTARAPVYTSDFTSADSSPSVSYPSSKRGSLSDAPTSHPPIRSPADSDLENGSQGDNEDNTLDESDAESMDSESGILTAKQARRLQRLINANPVPDLPGLEAVRDLEVAMGDKEAIRHMERLGLKDTEASQAVSLARRNPRHPLRKGVPAEKSVYRETAGDILKRRWIELGLSGNLLELFFDFPWNNFLHSIVCDVVQQTYQAGSDAAPSSKSGRRNWSRELVEDLLCVRKITVQILFGWTANEGSVQNARQRLGYMGHLTQMAEHTQKFLQHNPHIANEMNGAVDKEAWKTYVNGPLAATRAVEDVPLGGAPPPSVPENKAAEEGIFGSLGSLSIVEDDSDDEDGTQRPSRKYFDNVESSSLEMLDSDDELEKNHYNRFSMANDMDDSSSDEEIRMWRREKYALERFSDDSDEEKDIQSRANLTQDPIKAHDDMTDDDDFGEFVEAGDTSFDTGVQPSAQTQFPIAGTRHTRARSAPASRSTPKSRKRSNSQTHHHHLPSNMPPSSVLSSPSSQTPAGRDVLTDSPPSDHSPEGSKTRPSQDFTKLKAGRRARANSNADRRMHIEIDGRTIEVPRDDFSLFQKAEQEEAGKKASPPSLPFQSPRESDPFNPQWSLHDPTSESQSFKGHKRTNSRTISPPQITSTSLNSNGNGGAKINARSAVAPTSPTYSSRSRRASLPNLNNPSAHTSEPIAQSRASAELPRMEVHMGAHERPMRSSGKRGHSKRHSMSSSISSENETSSPTSTGSSPSRRGSRKSSRTQLDLALPTRSSSILDDLDKSRR